MKTKQSVIENLNEVDLSKIISIEGEESDLEKIKLGKIVLDSQDSNRRVEEKSEVKFFLKKYVCLKQDGSLKIFNKDYKNICKKNIEKMNIDERIIRMCLLSLYHKQTVLFRVHKDSDPYQWKRAATELKIADMSLYEEFLYYQISVESIIFPQPSEPKSINLYDKYIKKYQDEIRYLISVQNFTEAISWANSVSTKFFNMSKELSKQMTDQIRKKLLPEMKLVILNKTFAICKKDSQLKNKDYEEVIKIITKDYYTHFPEQDEKWAKITRRLINCYIEVKDIENAEVTLNYLRKIAEDDDTKALQKVLDSFKQVNQKKNKKSLLKFWEEETRQNGNYTSDDFVWDNVVQELDLNTNLALSVINTIKG